MAFKWHHPSKSIQLVCLTSHPSPLCQLYVSETPRMRKMRVVKVTITATPMTTTVTPMTTTVTPMRTTATIMTMEMKTVAAAATPTVMTMQIMLTLPAKIMVTVMMATAQVIAPTIAKMVIERNKDIHPTKPAILNTMMRNISIINEYLDKNLRIFAVDGDAWELKGHYDCATSDNEPVSWVLQNNQYTFYNHQIFI